MELVQLPSHFTPTHQTSGLPGFPAVDVFAPAGSHVACMVNGWVCKLSGHPPTPSTAPGGPYGWSIYVTVAPTGKPGPTYYATHFGRRAPAVMVGARVRRGQLIGIVADYSHATHGVTPSHIHLGFHAAPWHP